MRNSIVSDPNYIVFVEDLKTETNEFFQKHIRSLETELKYKDVAAVQKYLNDGVFAVQYTRFLNRLSNRIKLDFKKMGKQYLENHYNHAEDSLDAIIRFTKEIDQFYIKQEQLTVTDSPFQMDKTDAYIKGMSAGVLTATLTYGIAALVFKAPFLISTATAGALGTLVGGKITKSGIEDQLKKAKAQEKQQIIRQVKIALQECRTNTMGNIDKLLSEFITMFSNFLKGLNQDALATT